MSSQDLLLDHAVRDWVLIPLTASIILMKLLQQYAVKYMSSGAPAKSEPNPTQQMQQAYVARSALLRSSSAFLGEAGWRQRRQHLTGPNGVLREKPPAKNAQEALGNPDFMMGMLKQQLGGLVPQMGMGAFVNYFFSGFILGRIPFALSPKFRVMLQRGIDLPALDPSYFTSLSFYILALFGLGGLFRLVFADDAIDDAAAMAAAQMGGMGAGGPSFAFDAQKAYDAELNAHVLAEHRPKSVGAEARATRVLRGQRR